VTGLGKKKKGDPPRPEVIQVGPFIYTVNWDHESWSAAFDATVTSNSDAVRAYGMTDQRGSVIHMNPNNAETFLRETLLHEVTHACHFVAGLGDGATVTCEEFVTRVSPVLLDTLRRNPELRDYITWMD
jgi:hypothetical protein